MKKCMRCGCYNQDERMMCADCGRTLVDAEKVSKADLDAKLEKASRYSDPFAFKPRHQVVFYLSLLLFAATITLSILLLIQPEMAFIACICFGFGIPFTRFPETMWKIEKARLQFRISGNIEPSDWWFIGREIGIFGVFGIGVICFLYGLALNGQI